MIRPSSPDGVAAAIAALIEAVPGRCRVVIDGAPAAGPATVADACVAHLGARPARHVRADGFWRPASLRFEHGRENPETWLTTWLDEAGLRRELIEPFAREGRVLPALRDPARDRSVRATPEFLPDNGVLLVSGSALLGRGLDFDVTVHLHLTAAALSRQTASADAWTLTAIAQYESGMQPDAVADLVIRADDPKHPAIEGL